MSDPEGNLNPRQSGNKKNKKVGKNPEARRQVDIRKDVKEFLKDSKRPWREKDPSGSSSSESEDKPQKQKQKENYKTIKYEDITSWAKNYKIKVAEADSFVNEYAVQHGINVFRAKKPINPHSCSALCRAQAMRQIYISEGHEKKNLEVLSYYGADRDVYFCPFSTNGVNLTIVCAPDNPIRGDAARAFNKRVPLPNKTFDVVVYCDVYQEGVTPDKALAEETLLKLCRYSRSGSCYGIVRAFFGEADGDLFEIETTTGIRTKVEGIWTRNVDDRIDFFSDPTAIAYSAHPDTNHLIARTWGKFDVSPIDKIGPYYLIKFAIAAEEAQPINPAVMPEPKIQKLKIEPGTEQGWIDHAVHWLTSWWTTPQEVLVHSSVYNDLSTKYQLKPLHGQMIDSVTSAVSEALQKDPIMKALKERVPKTHSDIVRGTIRAVCFHKRDVEPRSFAELRTMFWRTESMLTVARSTNVNPPTLANTGFLIIALVLMFLYLCRRFKLRITRGSILDVIANKIFKQWTSVRTMANKSKEHIIKDLRAKIDSKEIVSPYPIDDTAIVLGTVVANTYAVFGAPFVEEWIRQSLPLFWVKLIWFLEWLTKLDSGTGAILGATPIFVVHNLLDGFRTPELFWWRYAIHSAWNAACVYHFMDKSASLGSTPKIALTLFWIGTALKQKRPKIVPQAAEQQNPVRNPLPIAQLDEKVQNYFEVYYEQRKYEMDRPPESHRLDPYLVLPAHTTKKTEYLVQSGTMDIKHAGQTISPTRCAEITRERKFSTEFIYPLLITNGLLWQPSNSVPNLLACLTDRIHKEQHYDEEGDEDKRNLRWKNLAKYMVKNNLAPGPIGNTPTIERCAEEMGGKRGKRLLEAYEKDKTGQNSILGKSYNVKWNETIMVKENEGFSYLKPRAICNLEPILHSRTAPYARAVAQAMHQKYDGTICSVEGHQLRIWFASGYTTSDLSNMFSTMEEADENGCAVAGDDSLVKVVTKTETFWFYCDFGSFDQSQDRGASITSQEIFEKEMQIPKNIIEQWASDSTRPYKLKRKQEDIKINGKTKIELSTGSTKTTNQNSQNDVAFWVSSFRRIKQEHSSKEIVAIIENEAKELGLTIKISQTKKPEEVNFLKGWFPKASSKRVWVPFPSMVVKLGKIMTDPEIIFPRGDRLKSIQLVAGTIASTLHYVPRTYPLLGGLLENFDQFRHDEVPKWDLIESLDHKPKMKDDPPVFTKEEIEQCYLEFSQKYNIEETHLRMADCSLRTAQIPSLLLDTVYSALAIKDYG